MLKKLLVAGCVLAIGASSVIAHPGGRAGHRKGQRIMSLERIAERLELTPSQIETIRAQREKNRESRVALRDGMKAAAVEYRSLKEANDPRASNALDRLRNLRDQMMAERLAARADFEKILTPEQREKVQLRRRER